MKRFLEWWAEEKNNIVFTVIVWLLIATMIYCYSQAYHYRINAMDLCAWHARRMNGDDPSSENATKLWREVISGNRICPFCGQKHDRSWVSRNAWDSQVNAIAENIK